MEPKSILKLNWERRGSPVSLSEEDIQNALGDFTSEKITSYALISQGCVNSNYKVSLSNGHTVILRVYTRDPDALMREFHIHELIYNKVPVPRFLYINNNKTLLPYPFAIMEYVTGHLFRDLILESNETAIKDCAYHAGQILTQISSFDLKTPGFFEPDLTVKPFDKNQTFYDFIASFLINPKVTKCIGKEIVEKLQLILEENNVLLIQLSRQHNLTHGDYDPSNMLVKCEKGQWKIAAVLDWEFAFSSSSYLDIGLMLRYAPQLPFIYHDSFMAGIRESNPSFLDSTWELKAKLMDILSLLSLLESPNSAQRPNMIKDIKGILRRY